MLCNLCMNLGINKKNREAGYPQAKPRSGYSGHAPATGDEVAETVGHQKMAWHLCGDVT